MYRQSISPLSGSPEMRCTHRTKELSGEVKPAVMAHSPNTCVQCAGTQVLYYLLIPNHQNLIQMFQNMFTVFFFGFSFSYITKHIITSVKLSYELGKITFSVLVLFLFSFGVLLFLLANKNEYMQRFQLFRDCYIHINKAFKALRRKHH